MNLDDIIAQAKKNEFEGRISEAVEILQNAFASFELEKPYILLELGELYFRSDRHLQSIETLIKCYNMTNMTEIKALLLNRYHEPNKDFFKDNYENNKNALNNYVYFYGSFPVERKKIIYLNQEKIIYLQNDKFEEYKFPQINLDNVKRGEIILIQNYLNVDKINLLIERTYRENFLWMKDPVYLYYDDLDIWELFLQLYNLKDLLQSERLVFCIEKENLINFLTDLQIILPYKLINDSAETALLIRKLAKEKDIKTDAAFKELNLYYNKNYIVNRIKTNNIRILFFTSRFSTVVQYHTRDCLNSCQYLGYEADILMEKNDISKATYLDLYTKINEFKPDIIFVIDHFRFEYNLPENMIFVTWIQDPLPIIQDVSTPNKLGKRDIILQHIINSQGMIADYSQCNIMDALIPSNEKVYKEYILSQEEIAEYGCDICLVCHASNFTDKLNELLLRITDVDLKESLRLIAEKYFTLIYNEEREFFSRKSHIAFLKEEFFQLGINIKKEKVLKIAEEFYLWLRQAAVRVSLVSWLLDAGYTNIKLWGKGWENQPKFAPYAMGVAQNGEKLSKIYQASKINLGNNIATTSAARAWESILSGGFYLSNYIPPEYDAADIRTVLKEDEEIKFFYNKKDLLDKVAYYLNNEEERKKMIKKGKERALEKMTFAKLMARTIDFVKKTLTENEDE